jgi:hypothetical protein
LPFWFPLVLERQQVPRDSTIPRMFEEQLICWTGRDWRNPGQAAEVAVMDKHHHSASVKSLTFYLLQQM